MKKFARFGIILLASSVLFSVLYLKLFSQSVSLHKNIVYKRIESFVSGYIKEESMYSIIYFTEKDREYAEMTRRNVDFYVPLLFNDFGLSYDKIKKPILIFYPDEASLEESLDIDYSQIPMGVYYGGVVNILSPQKWIKSQKEHEIKDVFMAEGPIIHEITHYLTDVKTNSNCPVWLSEGVSLYYEYKYSAYEWRPDLKEESKSITYYDLENNFNNLDVGCAYRRAFDIVSAIVDKKGEKALQNLLKAKGED